jgi:hypothetical protein
VLCHGQIVCVESVEWDHIENKCPKPNSPQCMFCTEKHLKENHICNVIDCKVGKAKLCRHISEKCVKCKGPHISRSGRCTGKKAAIFEAKSLVQSNYRMIHSYRGNQSKLV